MQQTLLDPVYTIPAPRHEFDRYDSPHWFLTHLPKHLTIAGTVLEPCVGGGNLSQLLPHFKGVTRVWTNDLDPKVTADFNLDATDPNSWKYLPPVDWVITNPPFNSAFPILQNALIRARIGVVFFLRLTFLEPTKERGQWLYDHPRYLDLIYPRFKFRRGKDGRDWQTDSVPIAAFIWRKDTTHCLGSRTIPAELIEGWHDCPANTPTLKEQTKFLCQSQQ